MGALKLREVYARNFKGVESIRVEFDRDHTEIIGLNGDGKTTLKQIIQVCCAGISQKGSKGELVGERFRYIGNHSQTADVMSIFEDISGGFTVTIANHITKTTNAISITASDGRTLTKEWLSEFFNFAFMSAESFLSHTPAEQTKLLGIDTAEFDEKIAAIKMDYTVINRELKSFGSPEPVEQTGRVDVHALYKEKEEVEAHNRKQDECEEAISRLENLIAADERDIKALENQTEGMKKTLESRKSLLVRTPKPEGHKPITQIQDKIDKADEINQQADAYDSYVNTIGKIDTVEKRLEANKKKQAKAGEDRLNYITGFKLPFKGLSVDEGGGLLLDDRRISTFSTGEQVNIVAKLLTSQNPQNKTVWIDSFESLDAKNQKKVVNGLIKKGYRVITTEVGSKKKGKGSILLKGCAIAGDEKKETDDRPSIL